MNTAAAVRSFVVVSGNGTIAGLVVPVATQRLATSLANVAALLYFPRKQGQMAAAKVQPQGHQGRYEELEWTPFEHRVAVSIPTRQSPGARHRTRPQQNLSGETASGFSSFDPQR